MITLITNWQKVFFFKDILKIDISRHVLKKSFTVNLNFSDISVDCQYINTYDSKKYFADLNGQE